MLTGSTIQRTLLPDPSSGPAARSPSQLKSSLIASRRVNLPMATLLHLQYVASIYLTSAKRLTIFLQPQTNQFNYFYYPWYTQAAFEHTRATEQPVSQAVLFTLTTIIQPATSFKGPVHVVSSLSLPYPASACSFAHQVHVADRSLELKISSSASATATPSRPTVERRAFWTMCRSCILLPASSPHTFRQTLGALICLLLLSGTRETDVWLHRHSANQHISAPETYKEMLIFVKEVFSA